jgi:hypothetical protein
MSRDSALAMLTDSSVGAISSVDPTGMQADSLSRVWRETPYLVDGKRVTIIWYSPTGEKRTATDTVPDERVIPVVLIDGRVTGIGRTEYDRVVSRYGLPKNKY